MSNDWKCSHLGQRLPTRSRLILIRSMSEASILARPLHLFMILYLSRLSLSRRFQLTRQFPEKDGELSICSAFEQSLKLAYIVGRNIGEPNTKADVWIRVRHDAFCINVVTFGQ